MDFGVTKMAKLLKISLFIGFSSLSALGHAELILRDSGTTTTPASPATPPPAANTSAPVPSTDCPTVNLLQAAPAPLRVSVQLHGTCYAHATVRAMDYLNNSLGRPGNTSILATILALNSASMDNFVSTENGGRGLEAMTVIRHLQQNGGCKETPWDRLPENGGEAQLDKLNSSVPEINAILDSLATSGNPQQILSSLNETSRYLLTQASQYQNLATVAQDLKRSRGSFMAMAHAIFRKAFCQGPAISHTAGNASPVYIVDNFNNMPSPQTLKDSIRNQFALSNPQPLIASLHANYLVNLNMYDYNSPHRVLIVGQKFDGYQCKYQLLNSWSSTIAYDSSLEADYVTGSVWVPLDQLHKKLYRLISIRPR